MDTLLILRDTVTAHVVKVVDSCQSCVQEAEMNSNGVWITLIICLTAVVMAVIVTLALHFQNMRKVRHDEDIEKSKKAINNIVELEQRIKELEGRFEIPSDEKNAESFIEFCQSRKIFEDKMAEKCIAIYEELMKKRLKV